MTFFSIFLCQDGGTCVESPFSELFGGQFADKKNVAPALRPGLWALLLWFYLRHSKCAKSRGKSDEKSYLIHFKQYRLIYEGTGVVPCECCVHFLLIFSGFRSENS